MSHIAFPSHHKLLTLPSGPTYSYVYIPSSTPSPALPTLLFLHGFPSTSYDFRHQIRHFSLLNYPILVPDLLGYGLTSRPESPTAYRLKKMASEIIEILDDEQISKVQGIAHDFGSALLSRLINYHPHRFSSATFISVPYQPPSQPFDLDAIATYTKSKIGAEKFGYMRFLSRLDSGRILDSHSKSFASLIYSGNPEVMHNFYPPGKCEEWVKEDKMAPLPEWLTREEIDTRNQIFSPLTTNTNSAGESTLIETDDGDVPGVYQGPTNWYRAFVSTINMGDEKEIKDPRIPVPCMMITEKPGEWTIPGFREGMKEYGDVRFRACSSDGHWLQLECKDEVNGFLEQFLGEINGGGKS